MDNIETLELDAVNVSLKYLERLGRTQDVPGCNGVVPSLCMTREAMDVLEGVRIVPGCDGMGAA